MSRPGRLESPYHLCVAEFEASGIRISDTERESALTALGEHMGAGRLDIDEYGERSAKVSTAKTRAELLDLFTDLPEPHPTFAGATAPAAQQAAAPSSAPARTDASRMVAMRTAAGVLPLVWLGAIALIAAAHFAWFIILVPIALTMMGSAVWGKGWNKQRPRRGHDWERTREELRDARETMHDGIRQARRQWQHEMRNQRRMWQQDLKHQIRNDVYRRMRDQRNRGRN